MSHSQFHSTKLFILRHAWLNLWDKHMTTGRINQVTTNHFALILMAHRCHFHRWEFIKLVGWRVNYSTEPQLTPPCSPDLTNFKHSSPCHKRATKIMAFKENYQQLVNKEDMLTAVVVDSQMANCNRFGYQQAIPHSPFIASTSRVLVL